MQRWKLGLIAGLSAIIIAWGINDGVAQIYVKVPDVTCAPDDTISIPILVSDFSCCEIISYQFEVRFDSAVIRALGASAEGTITASWGNPAVNLDSAGRMIVGNFGTHGMPAGDTLVKLIFRVLGKPGDTCAIVLKEFQFNNGNPSAVVKDGRLEVRSPTGVENRQSRSVPRSTIWLSNSPEPLRDRTVIQLKELPLGPIEIEIFNILGQRIKQLGKFNHHLHQLEVEWDATDQRGQPVPPGIYFCMLKQFNRILAVDRMIVIK